MRFQPDNITRFGRRLGLVQDAIIMLLGLLMLTASWGANLNGWVICYAWSLFVYGIGVGGEYPMTATAAMENFMASGRISTKEDRLHRGRNVTLAFLMQGWGQLFNQLVLILLLVIFNGGNGHGPYETRVAHYVFRMSFGVAAVATLWLVYHRAYWTPSASHQLNVAKKAANVTGYDTKSLRLTLTHFGSRLFSTSGTWFCNDFFFYGNKLFQSEFISVISYGTTSVLDGWEWNLANIAVSLLGYHLAGIYCLKASMHMRLTTRSIVDRQ
jgi:MFS family permease